MNKKYLLALAGAAGIALPANAIAGEATTALEEVVVTATKTGKGVSEAPASVSVVTAKNLETRNVQRVDEALTDQAGIYIKGAGDHAPSDDSGTTVYMRGIAGLGRTAVLLDGQSLNSPFSSGVNWSGIFAEDIDKIEIVRGPFSSLYGGNAMGGVINIMSKAPQKREIVVRGGYGSNELVGASAVYRNKVDRLGISLGYGHKESNGFAAEEVVKTTSSGAGTTPVSGAQRTTDPNGNPAYLLGDKGDRWWWRDNADLKLYYDLTPSSNLSLRASWNRHETGFTGFNSYLRDASGNPVAAGSIGIGDDGARRITLREADFLLGPNGAENTKLNLGYETRLANEVTLKADAGYMDSGYWYVSQLADATSGGGSGKLVDIPNDRLYGNLQASFPAFGNHFIVMGASSAKDEVSKREYSLANWQRYDAQGSVRYSVDGKNTTYALFAQDEIILRDSLTLYLGGRYDYWETEGSDSQTVSPTFDHVYSKRNQSAFSPKVSLVYLAQPNTSLRASVGSAFRGPSLSQLYSSFSNYQSNPELKPEKTTSWEIGAEHKFANQTALRATYYENYLTDLIYTTSISSTLSTPRNAGRAEVKGIELEIRKPFTSSLTAFANVTYNDARITENAASPETVGKRMTYTPQTMFNAGVELHRGPWSGSLSARHVGDVYTNDKNLDRATGVYAATDPYTIWNAKASYRVKQGLSVSLAVDNLLDRNYYVYYKAAGRTWYGEVKLDF